MAKRQRSQIGERISACEVTPSGVKFNVTCPICMRKSWVHRVFNCVPAWGGGYDRAPDPWLAASIELDGMRRWPRKPDGARGFYWERLSEHDPEVARHGLRPRVEYVMVLRMVAWLEYMGFDVSSVYASVAMKMMRERVRPAL